MKPTARLIGWPSRLAAGIFRTRGASIALFACAAIGAMLALGPPRAGTGTAEPHDHHDMPMSDEAMEAHAGTYWATHARVGSPPEAPQGVPAATFTVGNFFFDNGMPAQVDTARILVGESVMWQWIEGFHTITNGQNSFDPNAGTLFNQPSDSGNQQFTYTFNSAGNFPFFCAFHEFQNMFGVVVVSTPTGVDPAPGVRALGFTRDPAPNPSAAGMSFHYALRSPGRARAEVFDAAGRLVALLVDHDLSAGSYAASWNGRTPSGIADTGVYYVRLRLPGYDGSRRIVVRR